MEKSARALSEKVTALGCSQCIPAPLPWAGATIGQDRQLLVLALVVVPPSCVAGGHKRCRCRRFDPIEDFLTNRDRWEDDHQWVCLVNPCDPAPVV